MKEKLYVFVLHDIVYQRDIQTPIRNKTENAMAKNETR